MLVATDVATDLAMLAVTVAAMLATHVQQLLLSVAESEACCSTVVFAAYSMAHDVAAVAAVHRLAIAVQQLQLAVAN
jgi:hypothetical protein